MMIMKVLELNLFRLCLILAGELPFRDTKNQMDFWNVKSMNIVEMVNLIWYTLSVFDEGKTLM